MAQIKVELRIVGLFFSKTVELDDTMPLSVKDVIDAYVKNFPIDKLNGLSYRFSAETPDEKKFTMLSFTHNYDGGYEEKGLSKDGLTIGGKLRPAGLYELQELSLDPIVVAWQYYVIDGTSKENKTKTLPGEEFTGFATKLTDAQAIKDGDTVIWRMVAIVRRPNVQRP
jgi:hypothetical protein